MRVFEMRTLHAIALATLLFTMNGCGPTGPSVGSNNGSAGGCEVDADCPGSQICTEALCTVVEGEPRVIGFSLQPPKGSSYPAQIVPPAPIDLGEPLVIGATPGVRVAGTIELVGVSGQASGQLKFKQRSTRDPFVGETRVEASTYELFVAPGRYDISFFPDDQTLPTRIWRDVRLELDTDPRLRLNAETVQITGTLSRTDALTREAVRVEGALVFAVARESGSVTSTAITNDSGEFSFNALQDSGIYDLYVAPAEPNRPDEGRRINYVPDVSFPGAFEIEDSDWSNLLDENPDARSLSLSLGEYTQPLEVRVRLSVPEDVERDIDWTDTSVTLETSAGMGVMRVRQKTGADGVLDLPLILGDYAVEVRTPPGMPVASARFESYSVDAGGPLDSLELVLRRQVEGVVISPEGRPVTSAQVTMTPREGDLAEPIAVSTDAVGKFSAWVDDVDYRVVVASPDAALPRFTVDVSDLDSLETIQLPSPVVARGEVLGTPLMSDEGGDWRELGDVVVRAFEMVDDERVILGEGKTDDDGTFRIILPARQ